jgi:hypothetical protein
LGNEVNLFGIVFGGFMSYTFRPAVREEVGLLIGLIGPSGAGKTFSAMRLASGIVGQGNRFAVIDTESRRALHYADMFQFDHLELSAPFRPKEYADAIQAADKAGYKAIVVDSFSHSWSGEGGVLDWQEEELTRMAGDDWKKREACKMASWIKPKMANKQMIQRLLQVKSNLILCLRAEEKVKMEKDQNNKTVIVPVGFQPICSKEFPYELTVSFLLDPSKPGFPVPIKLQEQHKAIFPLNKQISEEAGRGVSEWAKGGVKKQDTPNPTTGEIVDPGPPETPQEVQETPFEEFFGSQDGKSRELINQYVAYLSEKLKKQPDEIIKRANENIKGFLQTLDEWINA